LKRKGRHTQDGYKSPLKVALDLSSTLQPYKRQHPRLRLLGSPPDLIPKSIDPAGQGFNVRTKTRNENPYLSQASASPYSPICDNNEGLAHRPSLPMILGNTAFIRVLVMKGKA